MLQMRSWVLVATPIGEPECAAALYHLHPRPTLGGGRRGMEMSKVRCRSEQVLGRIPAP